MVKKLLFTTALLVSMLLGTSKAMAVEITQGDVVSSVSDLSNGDLLVLYAPGNNLTNRYFAGTTLTSDLADENNLFVVEFVSESTTEFYLKQLSTGKYVADAGSGSDNTMVTLVDDNSTAFAFQIEENATMSSKPSDISSSYSSLIVRLQSSSRRLFSAFDFPNDVGRYPAFRNHGGNGGWSVWVVYKATVKYSVTIPAATTQGSVSVTAGGEAVVDGQAVEVGTELVITANAEEGYELASLQVNGEDFTSGEAYTVADADVAITVSFQEETVVVENRTVTIPEATAQGCVLVAVDYEGALTPVADGQAVEVGTELLIVAQPELGYVLESLQVNGADFVSGEYYTVADVDVVITISFQEETTPVETRTVTIPEATTQGSVLVTAGGEDVVDGQAVEVGAELVITANVEEGYELVSLQVNGVDFASGETYTVADADVVITVSFQEMEQVEELTYEYSTTWKDGGQSKNRYVTAVYYTAPASVESVAIYEGTSFADGPYDDAAAHYIGPKNINPIKVKRGDIFTLNLTASSDQHVQVSFYADWNGDGVFTGAFNIPESLSRYDDISGEGEGEWLEIRGVYKDKMDVSSVTREFTVPTDAALATIHVRVKYQSSWHDNDFGGVADYGPNSPLCDGMTVDVPVTIEDIASAIDEVEGNDVALYYANGEVYTNAEGEILVYDLSGKLVKRGECAPVSVADLANGVYIVRVNGQSLKFVK